MTKITHVEEFTKPQTGKKGWKFTIDGKEGYISNDKPWTFKEGDDVSYTIEDKGTYKIFTLTRETSPNTGKYSSETTPPPHTEAIASLTKAGRIGATMTTEARQRAEIDSAISCSNAVYDLIGQGKVDWAQFDEKCDVGYNWLLSNMDETYGAK